MPSFFLTVALTLAMASNNCLGAKPKIIDQRPQCPTAVVTEGKRKIHLLRSFLLGDYVVEPPLRAVRHSVSRHRKFPNAPLTEIGNIHTQSIQEDFYYQGLSGVKRIRETGDHGRLAYHKETFVRVDGENRYAWNERGKNWILSRVPRIPEPTDGLSWEERTQHTVVHYSWKAVGDFKGPFDTQIRHYVFALVVTGIADRIFIKYFAPAQGNFYTVSLNPNEKLSDLDPAVHPAVGLSYQVVADSRYWVDYDWPGPLNP